MQPKKHTYAAPAAYQGKLKSVMQRFGVKDGEYSFDYSLRSAYIEFRLKGQLYRFEHSTEKAVKCGQKLTNGGQCFAQLVLALEDLARMSERGIYELSTWIEGMKALPASPQAPECLVVLGFTSCPDETALKERWRTLAKAAHPDNGGSSEYFITLKHAYAQALELIRREEPAGKGANA